MNRISALILVSILWSSLSPNTGKAAERSLCKGNCANSPIPMKDVIALSNYSSHLTKEKLESLSVEDFLMATQDKGRGSVKIPVIISNERFDPSKHSPKVKKGSSFREAPESALFLSFTMPSTHSTETEGGNRVSFESSTSNSMLHQTELKRNDGATRNQKLDGVSQVDQLTVEAGNKNFSITVSYREFELMGKPKSLMAFEQYAGDESIEYFHDMIGQSDPYDRKKTGLNQVEADIKDAKGKSLNIKPGKKYVLPLLINFKRFDDIDALSTSDGKSKTTLVSGVQVAVPLGSTFSQGGIGTHATLIHNRELRQGLVATFAAGMALNLQKTFGDGYQPFDKKTKLSWGADVSAGLTCLHKNGSSTTATLHFSADSTPLNGKDYQANTGGFLKRQSQAAATEQDYAIGAAVSHRTKGGQTLTVGVKEDIGGSQRKKNAIGGNNNRDIQYYVTYSAEF